MLFIVKFSINENLKCENYLNRLIYIPNKASAYMLWLFISLRANLERVKLCVTNFIRIKRDLIKASKY